jgi:hypothetical protein
MSQLNFTTQNGAQALALAVAGFPVLSIRNEYSPAQLEKLGCTAREAWQRGSPGTVSYTFAPSEELTAAALAFLAELDLLRNGRDGSTLDVTPTDVARIAAVLLHQRKPWADMWKKTPPFLRVDHAGEPVTSEGPGGNLRTIFPGFTSIRIDADPADLALLDKHR